MVTSEMAVVFSFISARQDCGEAWVDLYHVTLLSLLRSHVWAKTPYSRSWSPAEATCATVKKMCGIRLVTSSDINDRWHTLTVFFSPELGSHRVEMSDA